jgi:sulfatase maturation enzyme AslB (radical SAM superfamily)
MKAEIGAFEKDRQELHSVLPLRTPLLFGFHPTHICNFACSFCVHSANKAVVAGKPFRKEKMEWDVFSLMVRQLNAFPDKIKMVSIAGIGEPLTHPRIIDIVKSLKDSGTASKVQIITNASLLSPEMSEGLIGAGLDQLKVSLQGLNDAAYARITGRQVSFDELYANILYFSRIRRGIELSVKIGDIALEEGEAVKFYELFGDICDAVAIEHFFNMWKTNGVDTGAVIKASDKTIWGYEQRKILRCRQRFTTFDILPDGTFCLGGCHRRFGFESNIRDVPIARQWNCVGANKARR